MTLIACILLAVPVSFGLADQSPSGEVQQDAVCVWLKYDTDTGDGHVFTAFATALPLMEMANVFDVPESFEGEEVYLSGAAVYVKDRPDTVLTSAFRLKLRGVEETGEPGEEFFSREIPGGYPEEAWMFIDLATESAPGVALAGRMSFSVGVHSLDIYNPYIGFQQTDMPHLRSYKWNWSVWQLYTTGDLGIRAKLCDTAASPTEDSAWATVKSLFR
jgi:hypothetical protein